MFSGIIENIGTVKEYKKRKDYQLVLDTDLNFKDVKKGSSVCCNGAVSYTHLTLPTSDLV